MISFTVCTNINYSCLDHKALCEKMFESLRELVYLREQFDPSWPIINSVPVRERCLAMMWTRQYLDCMSVPIWTKQLVWVLKKDR